MRLFRIKRCITECCTFSLQLGKEHFEPGEFEQFLYDEASQLSVESDGTMTLSVSTEKDDPN